MSCDLGTATADWMVRRAAAERAVPFRALLERIFAARIVSLSEAARITTWRQTKTDQCHAHSTLLHWQPLGVELRAAPPHAQQLR